MAYTPLTIDMITRECLRLAHEKATFIGTINRQFDESFGKESGKIGDTLRIRLPAQYVRRTGSRVMDVQDSLEQKTQLVVATQDGVDMRFNSRELTLDLENFSKQHLEPAMAILVSGIESDVLQGVTKKVYNIAGTANTTISTLAAAGLARARLNQMLAPKDNNRAIQMDSVTMGNLVDGLKGLFQDSAQIKDQYREGLIGRTAMADYYENERVFPMVNSGDLTTTLSTYTIVDGDEDLVVSSFSTPNVGMLFTIAGVFAVHPETKAAYSNLQQFVVLAGSTSSVISTAPPLFITGARKNVGTASGADLTVSTLTTAALVFIGDVNSTYSQSLMYHKDAFTFATAELPIMGGAASCVRKTYDGISLRVWQDTDIRNDELLTRIDILYGFAAIRPQWACRLIGTGA